MEGEATIRYWQMLIVLVSGVLAKVVWVALGNICPQSARSQSLEVVAVDVRVAAAADVDVSLEVTLGGEEH